MTDARGDELSVTIFIYISIFKQLLFTKKL